MPEYQPMATNTPSDDMVRGYLESAEWCGLSEEDQEALELSVSPKWSEDNLTHADSICWGFKLEFGPQYDGMSNGEQYKVGMDLWLTRNRHGAGFWDGDWPEPFATQVTDWCHAWGEAYVTFDAESEILEIVE